MNVSLTPELDAFVQHSVKTGRYISSSEVVREALRNLQAQHESRQRAIDKLNEMVEIGAEQLRRGEVVDGETAFAELRERSRAYRAAHA